jgi:hypothetical protein
MTILIVKIADLITNQDPEIRIRPNRGSRQILEVSVLPIKWVTLWLYALYLWLFSKLSESGFNCLFCLCERSDN